MIQATIGFIVFGVHKDGLKDPMGTPFVDDALVQRAKSALVAAGLKVIEHNIVIASKEEARAAFKKMKCDDAIDAVVLFSGTWVWAAHMVGAIRDYCASGKGLLLWTHPGSQGWRPVGGLVLHGGLLEIGVQHKFVYGSLEEARHHNQNRQLCSRFTSEKFLEHVHHRHIWWSGDGANLRRGRSFPMDENVWHRYRLPRHHGIEANR